MIAKGTLGQRFTIFGGTIGENGTYMIVRRRPYDRGATKKRQVAWWHDRTKYLVTAKAPRSKKARRSNAAGLFVCPVSSGHYTNIKLEGGFGQ